MLSHLRANNFSNHFLQYVDQDPVHALTTHRNLERRCRYDRNIFFLIEDDVPVAVLCVAFTKGLPNDMSSILDANSQVSLFADHAIFYSVFRTDTTCTTKNAGAKLIQEAAQWIKANMPQISNFVTMSPIPNLSAHFPEPPSMEAIMEFLQAQRDPVAKFHIRNGARVLRTIPNADSSEKRKAQSFGHMVNYDYTPNIIGTQDSINN
jgi:malonyl-CoA decarboxylase